jgi:hypothetical protein
MIKIDEKLLIDDLLFTAAAFGCTNKDFLKKEYNNYTILNQSLVLNNNKIIRGRDILCNAKFSDEYFKYSDNSYWEFIAKIDANQELLKEMAFHYKRFLKKIRFRQVDYFDQVRNYSEKDFIDVIISYYASFGDKYYRIAKKYFDENRINVDSRLFDDAAGYFVPLIWLSSGYIYSLYPNYDSISASSIVHELGHAVDAETFLFPQQKKLPLFSDLLIEVPSTAFEIGLYEYLRNQQIDLDGGLILENNRAACLLEFFRDLRTALVKEELEIDDGGLAVDENEEEYDLRTDTVYGLGYYFAFHLNEIRKSSNSEFLRILNEIITTRKESSLIQSIDKFGINREDFINGRYIKPRIKENYLALKKRYKVD